MTTTPSGTRLPGTKQLEGMWGTRPVRPADGRTIAGVCAGIGARYRVDPTLVKVAFVVVALFGGSGVLLYLAAWLAMPGSRGGSAGHRHRSIHSNPGMIVVIVLAIIFATSFGNGAWSSGGLVGAGLMALGWWLLYQRTPTPPPGTSVDTFVGAPTTVAAQQFQRWTPRDMTDGYMTESYRAGNHETGNHRTGNHGTGAFAYPTADPTAATAQTTGADPSAHPDPTAPLTGDALAADRVPPAWDPLGAARFAWDLPDPTPGPSDSESTDSTAPERRSPLTLIVIGLAVITGAIGFAAHSAGADWFTPARIASLALVVLGVGLIVGSRRRRRSHATGLAPITLATGAAVIVLTAAAPGTWNDGVPAGGAGEREWKPLSENDIDPEYSLTVGSMTLDLRDITLTENRTVELRNGVGEIKVLVPAGMNIDADCATTIGDYTCPDGLDGGNDGTKGPVLTIDAHTGMGNVEVIR